MENKNGSNIVVAALFIIGGLVLLANNFGFFDSEIARIIISWPVLVMAAGVLVLSKKNYVGGAFIIAVGFLFFIPKVFDLPDNWIKTVWPVIFVVVGMIMLFKQDSIKKAVSNDGNADNDENYIDGYISIKNSLSDTKQNLSNKTFLGGKISNNFGKVIVDLNSVILQKDETLISADCSFGSIELWIPSYIQVGIDVDQNLSNCEDKRLIPVCEQGICKRIIIKGNISFGSLLIK
ncbi:MAG: LiaF-related protein [Bacteroidales bacterium]|nr:LiaF-related protein [Bacteroidales bacterium]